VEDIAGEALRVHANKDVAAVADVPAHEGHVCLLIEQIAVGKDPKGAVSGRQGRMGHALDQPFRAHPVLDQIRDRDDRQIVLLRELPQLGTRAIVPSSFMISQMTPA
jgi:hypothetical protein